MSWSGSYQRTIGICLGWDIEFLPRESSVPILVRPPLLARPGHAPRPATATWPAGERIVSASARLAYLSELGRDGDQGLQGNLPIVLSGIPDNPASDTISVRYLERPASLHLDSRLLDQPRVLRRFGFHERDELLRSAVDRLDSQIGEFLLHFRVLHRLDEVRVELLGDGLARSCRHDYAPPVHRDQPRNRFRAGRKLGHDRAALGSGHAKGARSSSLDELHRRQ